MQLKTKLAGLITFALFLYISPKWAMQVSPTAKPGDSVRPPATAPETVRPPAGARLPQYILGPNDELVIMSLQAEELANKPFRVTTSGDINLPLVGRIHAAGMTLEQLETEVLDRLKSYYRQPDVTLNVTKFESQPVSVIGNVGNPGLIQLEGRKSLIEVLSKAGGLKPDAGSRIKITRRNEWGPIPLPSAKNEGDFSVAEVNILSIENALSPEENIQIFPNDVISVPRADIVYVMGEVKKAGGFTLNNRRTISILEALARAEGITPNAALKSTKIIRPVPGSSRIEMNVDLKAVLNGKSKDMMLQPDDILFVPGSYAKNAMRRALDTTLQTATGLLIYRY